MEKLSLEEIRTTIKNMEIIMGRVSEVVEEIGFLTSEFDTLDTEKTEFDDEKVYITAYDSHYDMYDCEHGNFPIEFLVEPAEKHQGWYQKLREERERIKEEKRNQEIRDKELQELERLKAKYEH